MRHVLFYTDTPNVGGAEKQMLLLAKNLKKKGVKVSLAYGKYSQIYKMRKDFDKVCEKIYVIPVSHKHDPRYSGGLKKIFASAKFDLVHLHLWNPGSCRYAFFAVSKAGIPIVTTEHDPFELEGVKKMIKKWCMKKTARTIVISMDNFRLLDEYYGHPDKRLELVHNGIEPDNFLDNNDKAVLPVQKGAIVITCIAELHPRKGHKYLINAFIKLQSDIPQVELVLVGRGPAEINLKKQAEGITNIHFLGWRNDIPQILRASDIFVLPSLKEAFGLVILEAMTSGVITVATNNGGPVDIIQDGATGYLVPPSNSEAIAKKLSIIIKNPAQKADIEKSAKARVLDDFTADKMAERTLAVYEKVW